MTTAKGLGNGFPIGAVMTQGKAVGLLGAGSHGSTYGGTVLGSRVVYTVLDTLENLTIEKLCLSTPGFDIRCMQHEALYSRLYMS